ncbi:ATP-binding protein [uncultured Novosphingobium sp.]|uniref:HAMP domain-containing sensor histidine kinase n=1 Tax=uncultured Novosphingobium sp. TaxID=292277 RepID=UPI003749990F
MRIAPRSLRGLTAVFLALFLATTVLAAAGTYWATRSTIRTLVDRRIASESLELAPPGARLSRAELMRRMIDVAKQRDTADLGLLLIDPSGRAIIGNTHLTRPVPIGFSSLDDEDSIEGLSAGRIYVRDVGAGMRLAVFGETEPIDDYRSARRQIYLIAFGAIIVVVLLGLLLFRRLIGRRIREVRDTAQSIIDGDLSRRVPLEGDGGEFDQQAAAFNRMLDRVDQLMTEIRFVSNNISHEMRTPLARLRNELSSLENRADGDPLQEAIAQAREQVDDLLGMFAAMLRIAEIESGSRRAGFTTVDLNALVESVVETVAPLARERDQQIAVAMPDALALGGDRQLLAQALINLCENAVRHTPPGTSIRISADRRSTEITLTVADNGPGIPEDQRTVVMQRFGRTEHGRRQSGHGLGLPLVNAIVRLHRGTMKLTDGDPGLSIVITLPIQGG